MSRLHIANHSSYEFVLGTPMVCSEVSFLQNFSSSIGYYILSASSSLIFPESLGWCCWEEVDDDVSIGLNTLSHLLSILSSPATLYNLLHKETFLTKVDNNSGINTNTKSVV